MVVFKYGFGPLPDIKKTGIGLPWCREIIKRAEDWDSDVLLNLLSTAMLAIDPKKRLPARKCWEQALQLSVPSQSRCATPTQTSYSKSDCLRGTSTLYQATRGVTPTEAAAGKMTDEKINVRTHVPVEEFLLSSAKLPSFACSTSDVTTKLRRKGVDNGLNDRYYEGLDFEDEEIGFYQEANQIEPQQSREYDQQQAAEDSNQKDDEIDNVPCDNEFDHDGFERNRANTHSKVVKKTRKHFSEVHRATLETAYCHNPMLHRTAQAGIAEELGLEKYRVYVCSFIEALFSHANNCCPIEMV